ncbi:MAG: transporter [Pseudomonadota bacterium]
MKSISLPVFALLLLTPMMIAAGQVLFKVTSQRLFAEGQGNLVALFFQPTFILALAIYGSATLIWIFVLKTVPLGFAYSFMALTFIAVPLLATWLLGEPLTWRYALGTGLIMLGLVVANS